MILIKILPQERFSYSHIPMGFFWHCFQLIKLLNYAIYVFPVKWPRNLVVTFNEHVQNSNHHHYLNTTHLTNVCTGPVNREHHVQNISLTQFQNIRESQ